MGQVRPGDLEFDMPDLVSTGTLHISLAGQMQKIEHRKKLNKTPNNRQIRAAGLIQVHDLVC